MIFDLISSLPGLFLLSFLSATLLPGGSEATFLTMVSIGQHSPVTLLVVASLGNILGSVANYWLGRLAISFQDRKWFPASSESLKKSQVWFSKWGEWAVLLAWVPVIGDPITVAAGVMRMSFWRFLLLVCLSKTLRYLVIFGLFDLVV